MTSTTTQEFVITREFKAPRALVFQTWTDMNHLKKWMFAPRAPRLSI
jgi:uncharacterized protein YndB with AHSA1/START domain